MKYSISASIFLVLFIVLFSCNKNEGMIERSYACIFEQNDDDLDGVIDDNERKIMKECLENPLSSKSSIENNLIGEWELIGHGEGWIPTISQPCGYIRISEDELIYELRNDRTDIVSVHQWNIQELNSNGSVSFKFNIIPKPTVGLSMSQFCDKYMYGDATPRDGNMYLYAKID